jgi:endonuclease YncB( thermonuclease family)
MTDSGVASTGLVVNVPSGDRLMVGVAGRQEYIRLCGIQAPDPKQPLAEASRRYLVALLEQSDEQVSIDAVKRTFEGHLVAEVYLEPAGKPEMSVQGELLMAGMATLAEDYEACPNAVGWRVAQRMGQERRVGVWRQAN